MKKIILFLSFVLIVFLVGIYFVFWPKARFELARSAMAVSTCPIQPAFSDLKLTQCSISCEGGCCSGGTTCSAAATPCAYSDVSGTPEGGYPGPVLLSTVQITAAGLANGGQMLACGNAPTEMNSGSVAGVGGCIGPSCVVGVNDKNIFQKYYEIIKYGIASFKDKQ